MSKRLWKNRKRHAVRGARNISGWMADERGARGVAVVIVYGNGQTTTSTVALDGLEKTRQLIRSSAAYALSRPEEPRDETFIGEADYMKALPLMREEEPPPGEDMRDRNAPAAVAIMADAGDEVEEQVRSREAT